MVSQNRPQTAYIKVNITMYLEIDLKYGHLVDIKINVFPISNFISWLYKEFKNVSQKIIQENNHFYIEKDF
jgi:hypothetical protein